MPFPQYMNNSLVNLLQGIKMSCTGTTDSAYPPCADLPLQALKNAKNIVLLVIDGLGDYYVNELADKGLFATHRHAQLTSVFPSTTATAITTYMTGLAPQQHGITGWFTYMPQLQQVVTVLPCTARGDKTLLSAQGVDIAALHRHPVIFEQLQRHSYVVSPAKIVESDYNRTHSGQAQRIGYENLPQMFQHIETLIKHDSENKYIYAYWPEFDHLSHVHGNQSDQVAAHYRELQQQVEKFLQAVTGSDTLLLISADHGFIDTTPQRMITVNEHPLLQECLRLPLCGEPRAAYCYLYPHKQQQFLDYIGEHFQAQLEVVESVKLYEQGAFGIGEAHPELSARIGDYTLLMKENYIIKDWLAEETPFFHYGVHGGISEREMFVPLIVLNA